MEGTKTKISEASGLSAIVEAFPGASQSEGLSIRENTEFDGDVLVSGLADGVATHMGLALQNPFLQSITYNSTKFVMLEIAEYVFDGLGGFSGGNTLGFSIAQLKEMIKDVLEKLDTILDEPGESSFIFMEKAYEALEHGYCKEALDHFKDVVRKAIQGFSYATKKNNPEAMVSVTRLMIIAEFSIATYNDREQTFQTWQNLTEMQRVRIYSIIRTNLDRLIKALKTLKAKGLFSRQNTYDADNQDALDILLRQMVPILLDFEPNQSIANNPTGPAGAHKIVLHGTYIPQGISDAVQIGGDDTSLAIWKDTERLYVFYNGHFYSDTIDDSKELEVTVETVKHQVSMSGNCMKQEKSDNYVTWEVLTSIVKRDNKNMLAMMFKCFPNKSLGRDCLVAACKHGSVGCVDAVMQNVSVGCVDALMQNGYWSPLAMAAKNGKSDVIKQLINCYHADINLKNRIGLSALSLAIGFHWLDTVKLLLELGADRSNIQVTPNLFVQLYTMAGDASTGQGGRGEMEKYLKSQGIVYNLYRPL